jgi:hypothetical protein
MQYRLHEMDSARRLHMGFAVAADLMCVCRGEEGIKA